MVKEVTQLRRSKPIGEAPLSRDEAVEMVRAAFNVKPEQEAGLMSAINRGVDPWGRGNYWMTRKIFQARIDSTLALGAALERRKSKQGEVASDGIS